MEMADDIEQGRKRLEELQSIDITDMNANEKQAHQSMMAQVGSHVAMLEESLKDLKRRGLYKIA